ncbi:hypothetical protein BJX68DRAFT_229125 [Aspergillus pseudodeflectus]|uniref:F-box domain-containing protein n=1 Tax=Aspergillus pseudodeflectus TaxID=176178 RepID=A0ABR4KZC8_9EURO
MSWSALPYELHMLIFSHLSVPAWSAPFLIPANAPPDIYAWKCPTKWKREIASLHLVSSALPYSPDVPFVSFLEKPQLKCHRIMVLQYPTVHNPQQPHRETHLQRTRKPRLERYNRSSSETSIASASEISFLFHLQRIPLVPR